MIERPRELEQGRRKERERESLPHRVPYRSPRSGPVHGTSSGTRTSGGRLNLGLRAFNDHARARSSSSPLVSSRLRDSVIAVARPRG